MSATPRLLVLVAHPDDAELLAGGLAIAYRKLDYAVRFVSVTCGDAGHHRMSGPKLAERRRCEAAASAAVIGASVDVWHHADAHLTPTLELRWEIVREIRSFAPDLVLTHRTNDYHPDHRAVGQAVQDASYLVTVPTVVSEQPILRRDPVVAFLPDRFTRPNPLRADVIFDIGQSLETLVEMLACHESQLFEWLPFNQQIEDQVPADAAGRRSWLRDWLTNYLRPRADRYRAELLALYGSPAGAQVEFCEFYEISEYATQLDDRLRQRLFGCLSPT